LSVQLTNWLLIQIDFVAHDDAPYEAENVTDVYEHVKRAGKFLATQRTPGISTSDLITRIVKDYDNYARRNLKRGVSPSELNIGPLQASRLRVKDLQNVISKHLKEDEQDVRNNWEKARTEVVDMLREWESKSQERIRNFVRLFTKRRFWQGEPEESNWPKGNFLPSPLKQFLPGQSSAAKYYNPADGELKSDSEKESIGDSLIKTIRQWTASPLGK
jgi:hypothetical protein